MDVNTTSTTLQNSVNVCLSVIGEAPVNSITGNSLPTQVALAKQTIAEVGNDVQSKGWWFNTSGSDITLYSTDISDDYSTDIPEEARRYITIRAARVLQSRFIGNEELHKFSYNEELVSLATLQTAHVRNGGNSTNFNSFPSELKQLGIEEIMFLQGSAEEKLLTLRLSTELKQQAKIVAETGLTNAQSNLANAQATDVAADTTLKGVQANLVSTQALDVAKDTEVKTSQKTLLDKQASDVEADTTLKGVQANLVSTQATDVAKDTEVKEAQKTLLTKQASDVEADTTLKSVQSNLVSTQALDVAADTTLKGKQGSLIDAQTTTESSQQSVLGAQATNFGKDSDVKNAQKELLQQQKDQLEKQIALELTEEKSYSDAITGVASGTTYRDFGAELRMMGVQEPNFYQLPAYKKKEALKDASKLRVSSATETGTDATEISTVNNIRRMIGEAPITALNGDSMASEAVRLLRKTSTEMQGRGWWFNTEEDVTLREHTADNVIVVSGFEPITYGDLNDGQGNGIYINSGADSYTSVDGLSSIQKTNSNGYFQWSIRNSTSGWEYFGASSSQAGNLTSHPVLDTWSNNITMKKANVISVGSDMLSVEVEDYNARVMSFKDHVKGIANYLYNLDTKTIGSWTKDVEAKIIYERNIYDLPQKFKEYLEVRVAILLTEMYPRDNVDIQRLPRIERELEAYFKDRENDEGNYNIFDSYDASARIGINRNYSIV